MPFQWYVQNVYDSCARKGIIIPKIEVENTVRHFLKNKKDITFCEECNQEVR